MARQLLKSVEFDSWIGGASPCEGNCQNQGGQSGGRPLPCPPPQSCASDNSRFRCPVQQKQVHPIKKGGGHFLCLLVHVEDILSVYGTALTKRTVSSSIQVNTIRDGNL